MLYKNIVLADSNNIFKSAIINILHQTGLYFIKGNFSTTHELLLYYKEDSPDLTILSSTLPGNDVFQTVREIKKLNPNSKFLFIYSIYHSEKLYLIKTHGNGMITRECNEGELLFAIKQIIEGNSYFTDLSKLEYSNKKFHPNHSHTVREEEILILLSQGLKTAEISEKMNVSISTVNYYRSLIKRKLELKSVSELVKYAVEFVNNK